MRAKKLSPSTPKFQKEQVVRIRFSPKHYLDNLLGTVIKSAPIKLSHTSQTFVYSIVISDSGMKVRKSFPEHLVDAFGTKDTFEVHIFEEFLVLAS